jgi:GT2 family glycosyltransferase
VRGAIDALRAQTRPPDEILLVDNKPGATLPDVSDAPEVRVIAPDVNLGYPNAINFAMEHTDAEFVLCINPDARADEDCLAVMLGAVEADERVAMVGAQILFEDGHTTQAGANPLHPTGISPAGPFGKERERGEPRDALMVTGACCLFRREAFVQLGGFNRSFFLYYDDADIGWRARIAGFRCVYCPEAAVRHAYEFSRRGRKMFYLERNRLISVLTNYEVGTLARLAPLLVVTELGVLVWAAAQGWLGEKLEAYISLVRLAPKISEQRGRVQAMRCVPDAELAPLFDHHLESPFLPRVPAALFGVLTDAYLRLVRAVP